MNKKIMINILSYYLAWWGIAIFAINNNLSAIILISLLFIFSHFLLVVPFDRKSRMNEIKMILFFSILGILIDSLLHKFKIFTLKENYYIWLFSIWIIFTATFNYSLEYFLKLQPLIVFIIGGLVGPLTYFLASKISLIIYPINLLHFLIHFFVWGILVITFKYRGKIYA